MEKVEYGDINKFLVSIGIALIAISFLAPYLYLKEDFGLYVEAMAIHKYQPAVQYLITDKIDKVLFIQKYVLGICIVIFGVGTFSLIKGLIRWAKWQAVINEKFKKEIEKLGLEIKALTPVQVVEKVKDELEAGNEINKITKSVDESIIFHYLKVEEDVIARFEAYNSPNYRILAQQRLGNRFEVDVLLKATASGYLDRIVEIKYFRGAILPANVAQVLMKLKSVVSYYKRNLLRTPVPVLLIVYEEDKFDVQKIGEIEDEIAELTMNIRSLKRLKVEFINSKLIIEFDVKNLLKR
ncbi:hypothetical protein [Arcticibacter eurypsychrophilus]|uniref:hypothetical protein n=1 Tax=Arcticibacter eurypsychrophilus TaxID=1434752 RepID=UPI001112FCF0|nr:hypothetical protein [Arcticibacter eurypsychrophilus]